VARTPCAACATRRCPAHRPRATGAPAAGARLLAAPDRAADRHRRPCRLGRTGRRRRGAGGPQRPGSRGGRPAVRPHRL
ncbi:MAG: hypothetical protein AVDCRST_MAG77-249, partial [uncultured Chloroflexi bacterium]